MCNLSEGIEERAIEKTTEKFVLSMYRKGYTLDQIADVTGINETEVSAIVEKKEPVLV